ncbi:MAG: 2Fe-2S iron-sulfur cluster binding domain-containing protein [Pseudomonadales bacterium]|jgi:ferredoxin-NADP reductase/ferredoxin|nr:2Fe-2S iron-sulfur cluster binding domain-containing protein [Pseudomonadales bacterium]
MSVITFGELAVELLPRETVLEGLERAGQRIPNSCRSGVCQSCLMQALDGEPSPQSQRGLKQTLARQGYFLACQCQPEGDLEVALPNEVLREFQTQVVGKTQVADDVLVLRLELPDGFACRPGQYLNLAVDEVLRSYSVASVPERDGYIELHIRRVPGGRLSNWLHDQCEPGAACTIRGPLGECFYLAEDDSDFPILLAGTSTGLAPLEGILRDALHQGHRGPITLIHGALRREGLYHGDKLRELAALHPNFTYLPAVRDEGESGDVALLLQQRFAQNPAKNTRVFLCGAPELVNSLRRQVFLQGAASSHIHADPFVMAPAPKVN